MRVACFEVKDWEQAYLSERLPHDTAHFEAGTLPVGAGGLPSGGLPAKHTLRAIDALSVFIHSQVTPQVLEALPNLKFIATRSTGFDHVDLDACLKRGIVVSNVPSYGENTVAEHTMALLLMLSRKVHQSVLQVRSGRVDLAELTGFDLQGKTIGVIGAGHIGLHVIRIARGFGMRVLAYDVRSEPFLADLLGFTYATMNQLLAESDIVTLHCLRTAVRNRVLLSREDVVFTPHNAFNSREALVRILEVTLANLEAFRTGQPVHKVF